MDKVFKQLLKLDDPFVVSLLNRCNPFGATMENGHSHFFSTETEAYLYIMNVCYSTCPRGYIEMPYLFMKIYKHLSPHDVRKLLAEITPFIPTTMHILQVEWDKASGRDFLIRLFGALCAITGSKYNSFYRDEAYKLFKRHVELVSYAEEYRQRQSETKD